MRVLLHVGPERSRLRRGIGMIQQIAKPLHPRHGRGLRRREQLVGIDLLAKFRKNRGHIVEPTRLFMITDEINRRRFGRQTAIVPRGVLSSSQELP